MTMQRGCFYPQSHSQTQRVRYRLLCSARRLWWLQQCCPVSRKLLSEKTFLPWHHLRRMVVTACLWKEESENTGFQMYCILWWAGIDLRSYGRSLVMMAITHYPVMDELFFRGTAKVSFKASFCGSSSVWLALGWSLSAGLLQSREMLLEPETVGSSIPKRVKLCDFLGEYLGFMK